MKFTCLQKHLAQKLMVINRAVAPKATLSVLSHIKLTAQHNRLKLSATNLQWGMVSYLGAEVEKEGELAVPGSLLTSFVSALPEDRLTFNVVRGSLQVESGSGKASLRGMSAEEFPAMVEEGGEKKVSLPAKKLREALAGVTFASAVDESRPILTGVLFALNGDTLTLVGVDGFRLSEYKLPLKNTAGVSFSLVLPARSLQELSRLAAAEKEVSFSQVDAMSQVVFESGDSVLISRILEGSFPEYEQIIPTDSPSTVLVPFADFRQSIKLSALFTEGSSNVVKLSFEPNGSDLRVEAKAQDVGTNETIIKVKAKGAGGSISFNAKYLVEVLNYFDTVLGDEQQLEIRIKDDVSPGYFCVPDKEEYRHIIMPVRVQD